MLFGKLNTPATKVYQTNAFVTTTATASHLAVIVETYKLNGEGNFQLRFGNLTSQTITKANGDVVTETTFDVLLRDSITLTAEELLPWGTDDSVVLDIVAAKYNNSIVEKVEADAYAGY